MGKLVYHNFRKKNEPEAIDWDDDSDPLVQKMKLWQQSPSKTYSTFMESLIADNMTRSKALNCIERFERYAEELRFKPGSGGHKHYMWIKSLNNSSEQ